MLNIKLDNFFRNHITDKNDVALLFSGGTDSLTCLYSLINIKVKPTLYTFHLDGVFPKDLEVSILVASHFKLNHKIITIDRNITELKKDVIYLCKDMKLYRKTNIQCTYPFLYVFPVVKEKNVVTGLCADDLYGSSKSMSINYSKDNDGFDKARIKTFENEYSSAYKPIKDLCEMNGKIFIAPYRNEEIIQYFMKFSWKELNTPKQKQLAVTSYKKYYEELNVYRRNDNLQVGSKIREWHNELIQTDLNKNNRKRVDEIYKDLWKDD